MASEFEFRFPPQKRGYSQFVNDLTGGRFGLLSLYKCNKHLNTAFCIYLSLSNAYILHYSDLKYLNKYTKSDKIRKANIFHCTLEVHFENASTSV